MQIAVRHNRTDALIDDLLRGTLDLIFVHWNGISDNPEIESVVIADRTASLMMRADDQLAALAEIAPEHLAGRKLFVSPGHDDDASMIRSLRPLADAGIEIVRSPDSERRLIELLAYDHAEMCLQWHPDRTEHEAPRPMAVRPFSSLPISSPIALARRANSDFGRAMRTAWQIARSMDRGAPIWVGESPG
jgi:DNA-binding transcriptional LysR family regulator